MPLRSATLITVSVPTKSEGLALGNKLLRAKCIACAQVIGPISSLFRWKGEIHSAEEYLVVSKTTPQATKRVVRMIEELHPYECPVIEVIAVSEMNAKGIAWMRESLSVRPD